MIPSSSWLKPLSGNPNVRVCGCAPLGCGADTAFVGVRVKVDGSGTVTEAPKVFGMYQRSCVAAFPGPKVCVTMAGKPTNRESRGKINWPLRFLLILSI